MQVTPITIANSLLQNIQTQESRIAQLQQQESTGQSFQLPSDNPIAAETSLGLNNALSQIQAYTSSAQSAQGWLNQANGALTGMIGLFDQAIQTATQASNSTNNQNDLNSLAGSIRAMQANLGQLLNTQYQSTYIFGGYSNLNPPVSVTASGQYPASLTIPTTTNGQRQTFEITSGSSVTVNLTGWESVGQTAGQNYFQNAYNDLGALATAIQQGPQQTQALLPALQQDISNLAGAQALVGGRLARTQNTLAQLQNASTDISQNLATVEGANMAQVTTQLAQEETAYQAALQSGSKILSLSLLNFINP